MKTNIVLSLATAAVIAGLAVASCSKSNSASGSSGTSNSPNTSPAQVETQANDETQVSNEMDAATDDVNNSLNVSNSFSGTTSTGYSGVQTDGGGGGINIDYGICDATVTTDTANGLRQLVITYNGSNCWGNRTRTGVITISIPVGTRWRDTGAVVTVDIQNLKITRKMDNKTIVLNGTYTYTNVSGGLLKDLATLGTITHTISADSVSIEFADSATRIWSVSKQRVFTYNDGVVITTTGTHSDGTNNNVSIWGTNRYGNSFETLIVQPKVIAQSCDYQLVSGETETIRPAVTTTITYGLDSNGNPTGCPVNGGYYYYKETWTLDGKTYTWIAPY